MPADEWAGHCHEIACAIVRSGLVDDVYDAITAVGYIEFIPIDNRTLVERRARDAAGRMPGRSRAPDPVHLPIADSACRSP